MSADYTVVASIPGPPDVRVYAATGKVLLSVNNVERVLDRREVGALVDGLCEAVKEGER